jgi:hypothetical protein
MCHFFHHPLAYGPASPSYALSVGDPGTSGVSAALQEPLTTHSEARHWWLTPVILTTTQEAEIRRIVVRGQPRQIVHETLSRKNPSQKRGDGVTQGVGPEFKPQYSKKKK